MAEGVELLRLMTWLSPAFPVGAFAYSHGLERAIEERLVRDRASLTAWLHDLIEIGSGWNDAVLLAEAWRVSSAAAGHEVADLAAAMAGSRERHLETTQQGDAFGQAMAVWASTSPLQELPSATFVMLGSAEGASRTTHDGGVCFETPASQAPQHDEGGERRRSPSPYPVAVGFAARRHGVALEPALAAYLHAFASNLIQASVRLVPLGQRDGVATLARLGPVLLATARRAAESSLDDLGSCTFMSEIMSMRHETQYSRVFRT